MDSTIISAIITAVATLAGSIITAIISRLPQRKQKKRNTSSQSIQKKNSLFLLWIISNCFLFISLISFAIAVIALFLNDGTNPPATSESSTATFQTEGAIVPSVVEQIEQTVAVDQPESIEYAEPSYVLPGTIKKFGHYEQDNKDLNGSEDIKWIALTQKDDEVLIISVLGIELLPYAKGNEPSDWANCSLREWLNGTFYQNAFSDEEKENIIEKTIVQHKNADFPACDQGEDTIDRVFVLSSEEYMEYMYKNGNVDRQYCYGTASTYVTKKEEVDLTSSKYCWWWLRTSSRYNENACRVTAYGVLDTNSQGIHSPKGMVRPAMWVKSDWWNELQ